MLLRDVEPLDLPVLYEHQRDPEALRMAAFTPRERAAFLEHWTTKILGEPTAQARVIVEGGRVSGYVVSWTQDGRRLLGYWLDRDRWGRGLASAAVAEFLTSVDSLRPLDALVATSNQGSVRVLEKCGFELVPGSRATGADGIEEVRYRRVR